MEGVIRWGREGGGSDKVREVMLMSVLCRTNLQLKDSSEV